MSDWVNWQEFAGLNKPEVQRQADMQDQARMAEQAKMDTALNGLSDEAFSKAQKGQLGDLSQLGGYSALMASRDAALTQNRQQVAPWESELTKNQPQKDSPWASLDKRLGSIGNRAGQRNTQQLNNEAYAKQMADTRKFQADQKAKMDEAMNGKRNAEASAYRKWSDYVQGRARNPGGIGAGAYYDAAQGTGPQPVTEGWGERVRRQQKMQQDINKRQLMPQSNSSSFGQSTTDF